MEFGPDQGKNMILVGALCGLKSASASFSKNAAKKLDEMGFKSSCFNTYVWVRESTIPDGEYYYEDVFIYLDEILSILLDPKSVLKYIHCIVRFNNYKY